MRRFAAPLRRGAAEERARGAQTRGHGEVVAHHPGTPCSGALVMPAARPATSLRRHIERSACAIGRRGSRSSRTAQNPPCRYADMACEGQSTPSSASLQRAPPSTRQFTRRDGDFRRGGSSPHSSREAEGLWKTLPLHFLLAANGIVEGDGAHVCRGNPPRFGVLTHALPRDGVAGDSMQGRSPRATRKYSCARGLQT
jgi:hypothetical protein